MSGIRIKSNNFNGKSVDITFNPFSGGTINLGTQTIPYDYVSSNNEGDYSIYIPEFNKTCPLRVGIPPSPTPSASITPTPSITVTPTPTPSSSASAFSPADLTGLWDWWRADTNVNIVSGNQVNNWTGYNGNILSIISGNMNYISSDSDFNNEPSIWFNSGNTRGMRTSVTTSAASDKMLIMVCKTTSARATASDYNTFFTYNLDGNPRAGIFGVPSTSVYRTFQIGGGVVDITGSNFIDYNILAWSYNRGTGQTKFYTNNSADLTTTSNIRATTAGQNYNTELLYVGDYNNLVSIVGGRFKCVEIISIDAIPSPTEITNLENYLSTRYGL
jgi:hypothetical protein